MTYLEQLGRAAKDASFILQCLSTERKIKGIEVVAKRLIDEADSIIAANAVDMEKAQNAGMSEALLDRLLLTVPRLKAISEGLLQITNLSDPIGEVLSETERPNGLRIRKVRVPMGVIGIIYESRPNVTPDAFGLCFMTGNAVILRGGSDCIHSNIAIVKVIRDALESVGLPKDAVNLVEDTSRETATGLMKLNEYVDLLIPRGGAGLIRSVVENATIPVIETGTGNCHVFVDESGDIDMAVRIIDNAKTQRMGVCNACESLLVHEKIAAQAIPAIYKDLTSKHIEIRAAQSIIAMLGDELEELKEASEEDWGTEYLGPIISLQIVPNIDAAIAHVNKYTTHHSEAIITEDANNAERFLNEVDAAAVYVNASTRFTDGFEFGFGAEIGISTQKLHARGPMGLNELTSYKYKVYGQGQIR